MGSWSQIQSLTLRQGRHTDKRSMGTETAAHHGWLSALPLARCMPSANCREALHRNQVWNGL